MRYRLRLGVYWCDSLLANGVSVIFSASFLEKYRSIGTIITSEEDIR